MAAVDKWYCHEDGQEFGDLESLTRHLKSKTAWSNVGLVGYRVSVLLENREWSEGVVTQYHRSSGKHCVEFRSNGARRWLVMLRTAFFIVDRNGGAGASSSPSEGGHREEMKEPDAAPNRHVREPWTYSEGLTLEFARAQSVMHECYGKHTQEVGHKTLGHVCVTDEDKREADEHHGSLLYGELLPRGVHKALDPMHLDAKRATRLLDLGMGTGKIAMQAFLQFENLKHIYGVELSLARYKVAEKAAFELAESVLPDSKVVVAAHTPGKTIALRNVETQQVLTMVHGNLMATPDLGAADIIMLETDIPADYWRDLSMLIERAAEGTRVLTYLDLRKVWQLPGNPFPFRQLDANRSFADRYPTTWSVNRGHHLFLWVKVLKPGVRPMKLYHEQTGAAAAASSSSSNNNNTNTNNNNNNNNSNNNNNNGANGNGAASAALRAQQGTKGAHASRHTSWADEIACGHKWPSFASRSSSKKASNSSSSSRLSATACAIS